MSPRLVTAHPADGCRADDRHANSRAAGRRADNRADGRRANNRTDGDAADDRLAPGRTERGSVTPVIVGFAVILALGIALVTDATEAYLQRSGLSTLADGAALSGADAGATGRSTYTQGVPTDQLAVDAEAARAGVAAYLRQVRALEEYPGLRWQVRVDPATSSVHVRLVAPLDLPLTLPGSPEEPTVAAEGEASSAVSG